MVHYSLDTSYTRIEYPSADPYSTYTMYNPVDVRWDVLNDIMSSYNLHNYQILGLNGVWDTLGLLKILAGCSFRNSQATIQTLRKPSENSLRRLNALSEVITEGLHS
jgi:hypothetical protein